MILIAITGASGISIAIKLLNILKEKNIETGLIISKAAEQVLLSESNKKITDLQRCFNINCISTNTKSIIVIAVK